jgi:hypothetical protein|tara:strand:+ start:461 stop:847 length:387 start_codon:yes stop_codon:yes gene_type:complete
MPDAAQGQARLGLLGEIVAGIFPTRDGVSARHHPGVELDVADDAFRQDTVRRAVLYRCAAHRRHSLLPQGRSRDVAAAVQLPALLAGLIQLRRIDPLQMDPHPVDLDRVAVDNPGVADDVTRQGRASE